MIAGERVAELGVTWDAAGIRLLAVDIGDGPLDDLLANNPVTAQASTHCGRTERHAYADSVHRGTIEIHTGCSETDASVVTVALRDRLSERSVVVNAYVFSSRDIEVLDRVLSTLEVTDRFPCCD